MNKMRNNGRATNTPMQNVAGQSDLMRKIQELSLVKTELELYLDTHPTCKTALDYYYQTVAALQRFVEEYNNTNGPIVAMDSMDTERWSWTDTPWPWHNGEITAVPNCRKERR